MPITKLYFTWKTQLQLWQPKLRSTQLANFAWMMVGIYQSRSVHLSKIAGKVLSTAKLLSTVRRFERFLDNAHINVRVCYDPLAKQWVAAQWEHLQEIRLIVDGTRVGFGHQLLLISLAYRRRAIPLAWTWLKQARGHSSAQKQIQLLRHVKKLLPARAVVFLVGDSEFGAIQVLKQLDAWGWFYALRQKTNTKFRVSSTDSWQALSEWVQKPGGQAWLSKGYLTRQSAYSTRVLIVWKAGEAEPWCLATNLATPRLVLLHYRHRMWTEELFGDLKRHGFDLESTMLHTAEHLSRLTLVVVYLYAWLISAGTQIIHRGRRHLIDRKDRRDLSLFQIGWRFIERQLLQLLPFPVSLCTYL